MSFRRSLLLVVFTSMIWCVKSRPLAGGHPTSNVLPARVCKWRQEIIRNKMPSAAPSDCQFQAGDDESTLLKGLGSLEQATDQLVLWMNQVRHEGFLKLLGNTPLVQFEASAAAHEGGVYYPDKNEFYFSTKREPGIPVKLQKLHLESKEVETVLEETDFANGMVLDHDGNLLVCEQGSIGKPGYLQKIDLHSKNSTPTIVADNWFNLRFNGPNDVVVKSDKSIWFTDPDYASVQGFGDKPRVDVQVYRIDASGVVDVVANGFVKPNGLAFSHDEKLLYVTDTGYALGNGSTDVRLPHDVIVFDVEEGSILTNRRLFASVAKYDETGLGIPDGIKVDTKGRVYIATGDGIQVLERNGQSLGLIRLAGAANMGFGGPLLDTLYILNDTSIHSVKLRATAAGLPYAARFHNISS